MRKIWDIHGGIHPPENKQQSTQQPIAFAGIPAELILPLSQHIGAPASPIVQVGDKVLKGQVIAEAKGLVSAPVHAPSSGEVITIEQRIVPHPSGMTAPCIVISTDGEDRWIEHSGLDNHEHVEKTEILRRIRDAGIAGMGGAGFPSAVKLTTRDDKPIETLIINGTECEPYITADDVLMRERAGEIIAGVQILRHLVSARETLIGVEDNKPEAITALQTAARDTDIEIVVFPTKYPSGGEKQLIQILTGQEVPAGGLPADVGVICQNIGTAVAVYRAVTLGEPLISRITTVTGHACRQQRNFEVLLGTPIQYLLDRCGYDASRCSRLIMGGPMMGFTLTSTAIPVTKTTNCILAPTVQELPPPQPAQACIRCGMCAEACPVSLLPQQLYWFARGKEYDKLEAYHLMDCIECGACSYVCPSRIPLVQYYRASKAEIRQQKLAAQKAEHAKTRFEARKARIEREEAEKEAKRAARKAAAQAKASATAGDAKLDVVQAAIERAKAKKAAADSAQAEIDETTQPKPALTGDAAADAIARALAKREAASTMTEEERHRNAVDTIGEKLRKTREKLAVAEANGDDTVDILKNAVAKLESKLADAKAAQEEYLQVKAPN